jgi:hypothetical protein
MDARASDSFESIHDAVCALGVLERWQRRRSETEYSFRGHRSGWSGAAMKGGTEDEPYGQGYPFGVGEVAGESGDQLHEKKKQGDADTEARDEAQAQARLDEPEGKASGEPAERGGHRTNFGDGNEDGIAEEQRDKSPHRDADDRDGRRRKFFVDGGKTRSDGSPAGVREKQAR